MDVVEKNKIVLMAQIYRLNNGISARKFAGTLQVHHSNYSRIEKGSEACSDLLINKIMDRLGLMHSNIMNEQILSQLEQIISNQCNFQFREEDKKFLDSFRIKGSNSIYSYIFEIADFKLQVELNKIKKKITLNNINKIISNIYRCDRKYYFIAKEILGSYYTKCENYEEAQTCFMEVVDFCRDEICLSLAYFYLGIISAMRENKPFQALEYNLKARDLFVTTQNHLGLQRVELSIGNNYSSLGEYDKAIDTFMKNYASRNNLSESIYFFEKSQRNIILCYIRKGEYEKAIPFINRSYLVEKENELLYIYAIWIYYRLNQVEECNAWIELYFLLENRNEIYTEFISILYECNADKYNKKIIHHLLKLIEIKEKQESLVMNEFLYVLLIDMYITHGLYQKAYETLIIKNKYFSNSSRY